jgi:hypothetical protein
MRVVLKKGKIIYWCKYNFTICSLNLYALEVKGQHIEHVVCFHFILVWFVPVAQSSRYEGYEKRVCGSKILSSWFVIVYLFGTIDSKSRT